MIDTIFYDGIKRGGVQPPQYAKDALKNFREGKNVLCYWCRQSGKSTAITMAVKETAENSPVRLAVISTNGKTSRDLREKIGYVIPESQVEIASQFSIRLKNGSQIDFYSGEMKTLVAKVLGSGEKSDYDHLFFDEFVYTKETNELVEEFTEKKGPWYMAFMNNFGVGKKKKLKTVFLASSRSERNNGLLLVETLKGKPHYFSAANWEKLWNAKSFEEKNKQSLGSRNFQLSFEGYEEELKKTIVKNKMTDVGIL